MLDAVPENPVPLVDRRPVAALKRPRRNNATKWRQPKQICAGINDLWSVDFVADALFDGRKLRMLTVVDCFTRECLAIDLRQSLKGEDVVATLDRICAGRGLPMTIETDNGSESISKVMVRWAYERGVELDFSRPGKPADNARVESFNGRLRQECLNAHCFLSMEDASTKIEAWRRDYNESRPHSALDWIPPAEFARRCRPQPTMAMPEEPKFLLQSGTRTGTVSPHGTAHGWTGTKKSAPAARFRL